MDARELLTSMGHDGHGPTWDDHVRVDPAGTPTSLIDPLTGATVVIAGNRQARPNLPSQGCPFCVGGREAPEPYETRWFRNRWPAMPDDRCEVVLYTPDHDASFASLGVTGALRVIKLWAERTRTLGARSDIAYVLPFENRGPAVGATIAHPHGQIYAFDVVPPLPARELAPSTCPLCPVVAGIDSDLVVARHGSVVAWVPETAMYPYELRLATVDHVPDLCAAVDERSGAVARDLAATLVDVLGRVDTMFSAQGDATSIASPYMLWVHQRPTDGGDWPSAHLHLHITPIWRSREVIRYVAGAELGAQVYYNPVRPTTAAAHLRAAAVPADTAS